MASPETGSEKHRARAREVWDAITFAPGGNEEREIIAAALARVEAETLERAARAMCGLCRRGVSVHGAMRHHGYVHRVNDGLTERGKQFREVTCAAYAIRALASEPVAGDANPTNESLGS